MTAVTVDGRRVNVFDSGPTGPPILLVHDFPLHSGMWRQHLVHDRADRYQLVAPDLVGFGGSDAPCDPAGYGVTRWADDTAAVLRMLGLSQVLVAGNGVGGQVSLELWRRHPDLVAGLTLVAVATEPSSTSEQETALERAHLLDRGVDVEWFTEQVIDETVAGTTRRSEVAKEIRQFVRDNPIAGMSRALRAIAVRPDQSTDLDRVDVPVLVVAGADDPLVPVAAAERIAEMLPDGHLVVTADAGHYVPLENPVEFARLIDQFVAGL